MKNKEVLSGGRENKVFRTAERVTRPSGFWSPHVHRFLNFLISEGFTAVPRPYGISEAGEESLSYVHGEVFNDPLPQFMLHDHMIVSSAKLLRNYHRVSRRYIQKLTNQEMWMLPVVDPREVMCHGDFAPYNVTILDGEAYGMIDFDTVHPGPQMWDIAYAIYRWVPFSGSEQSDSCVPLVEQIRRAKLFLDTYGVEPPERMSLPRMMVDRLSGLVSFMRNQAEIGNHDVQRNIDEGHLELYLRDIQYIHENQEAILVGII